MTTGRLPVPDTDPNAGPENKGRHPVKRPIIPNRSPIALAPREILAQASSAIQRQANVSAFNETCRVVLGQDRIGGQLLNGLLTVPTVGNLLMVVAWCRGPISAINSVTINNVSIPAGVVATHYTGTAGQAVNATLVSAFASLGITHTYAFPGIAYSVFEFPFSADVGEFHAIIDGVLPYDIRNGTHVLATPSTWTFSKNPALLLAHIISNTTYGLGASMDWSGSTAAFNACDAITTGEVKRLIGYTMDRRMKASEVCEILRAHAGCFIVRSAGKYKLIPDAVASSVATFAKSTSTIIDKSVTWQLAGLDQQPNVVEVAYTDTSVVPWRTAVAVFPANAIPPTGEELRLTRIELPGCQRYSQAMREVVERRNHARLEPLTLTTDTYAESLPVEPGDVYTINDGGAFAGTLLRLTSRSMRRKGRFTLTGKKYDPSTYSSAADAAPTYANTSLPDPSGAVPTAGAVTLTEVIVTNASGALPLSKINASWVASSTYNFLVGYRVTIVDPTGVVVVTADVVTNSYSSPPLNAFNTYTVNVYARSAVAISATASSATISLVSSGVGSMAQVYSSAITASGWYLDGLEQFQLWHNDTAFRIRRSTSYESVETAVYTGSNMLTPGRATQLLDNLKGGPFSTWLYADVANSPIYNIGANRTAVFALLNIAKWLTLYSSAMEITVQVSPNITMTPSVSTTGGFNYTTGRYAQIFIRTKTEKFSGSSVYRFFWQIEFDAASIAALMPTVTDNFSVTTLSTGPLVVNLTTLLSRRYIVCNPPQVTPISTASVTATSSNLTISEVSDNTVEINAFDSAGTRIAVVCTVSITGVAA